MKRKKKDKVQSDQQQLFEKFVRVARQVGRESKRGKALCILISCSQGRRNPSHRQPKKQQRKIDWSLQGKVVSPRRFADNCLERDLAGRLYRQPLPPTSHRLGDGGRRVCRPLQNLIPLEWQLGTCTSLELCLKTECVSNFADRK